jgi:PncC family amidohydrolase
MATPPSIEEEVGSYFIQAGMTLATAESCTGGLIAHRLTNVSGASAYFLGSVVAYHNAVKHSLLGVPEAVLAAHGAVSEETARDMAEGVRRLVGATYGLAVTGIAGPTGGSADKPVGLVYLAVARADGTAVIRRQYSGTREEIKAQTAETAIKLLLEYFE